MKAKLKKIAPWILLLLIIISLGVWYFLDRRVTEDQLAEYNNILAEANTFFEAKQYSVSIKRYQDATEKIPTKVEAYKGIIDILLLKNRVDDATEIVEKAANSLSPNNKSILYGSIGNYYYSLKDYENAKNIYQKGLGLGVTNMEAEFMLGKTLLNVGKVSEAKEQLSKEGFGDENASESKLLLAYIEAVTNQSNAKSLLSSSTPTQKLSPYYEEFSEVLSSLTDDSKFNATKLARIYLNNGYSYLALNTLEPIQDQIDEYLDGLYYLGRAYLETGSYDKSIETLDKASTLGGMESEIFWAKGRAYLLKNDLDNSFQSYQRAINYGGKNVSDDLLREYTDVLFENKQMLKAEEFLSDVLETKGDPYLLLLTLEAEYDLKDDKKMDYYLAQLSKKDLSDEEKAEYIYWQVKIMLDKGEDNGIQELLDQLYSLSKYNPKYYLLKGRYDLTLNNTEDAKSSLEKSIEYDIQGLVVEESSKMLSNIK
jgi:tetratricopeptide (TPR) repeat protein